MYDPCTYYEQLSVTNYPPGALTQAAFSLEPTPSRSTTFSGSSPPTSVTVTRLELRARPALRVLMGGGPVAAEGRRTLFVECERAEWRNSGREKSVATSSLIGCETERALVGDCGTARVEEDMVRWQARVQAVTKVKGDTPRVATVINSHVMADISRLPVSLIFVISYCIQRSFTDL